MSHEIGTREQAEAHSRIDLMAQQFLSIWFYVWASEEPWKQSRDKIFLFFFFLTPLWFNLRMTFHSGQEAQGIKLTAETWNPPSAIQQVHK